MVIAGCARSMFLAINGIAVILSITAWVMIIINARILGIAYNPVCRIEDTKRYYS